MSDLLYVSYDTKTLKDSSGLVVGRPSINGEHTILKMLLDKEADDLYKLITDQAEKSVSSSHLQEIVDCEVNCALNGIMQEIANIEVSGYKDPKTMFVRNGEQIKNIALAIIDRHIRENKE